MNIRMLLDHPIHRRWNSSANPMARRKWWEEAPRSPCFVLRITDNETIPSLNPSPNNLRIWLRISLTKQSNSSSASELEVFSWMTMMRCSRKTMSSTLRSLPRKRMSKSSSPSRRTHSTVRTWVTTTIWVHQTHSRSSSSKMDVRVSGMMMSFRRWGRLRTLSLRITRHRRWKISKQLCGGVR